MGGPCGRAGARERGFVGFGFSSRETGTDLARGGFGLGEDGTEEEVERVADCLRRGEGSGGGKKPSSMGTSSVREGGGGASPGKGSA